MLTLEGGRRAKQTETKPNVTAQPETTQPAEGVAVAANVPARPVVDQAHAETVPDITGARRNIREPVTNQGEGTHMAELELEPESHRYTLDGVTIPGCTQVLAATGAAPGFNFLSPDDLEFYRSRGHAVHKAIELAVRGTLDKRTIVNEVNSYLIGWDRFCNDHEVDVIDLNGEPFVECPIHHPAFRYGVTPDVVARVDGKAGVVELKATSAHAPATGLQLAAQLLAVRSVYHEVTGVHFAGDSRIGLRLLPDEPYYDMRFYTEKSDEAVWLSMLNTYNWRAKWKLL